MARKYLVSIAAAALLSVAVMACGTDETAPPQATSAVTPVAATTVAALPTSAPATPGESAAAAATSATAAKAPTAMAATERATEAATASATDTPATIVPATDAPQVPTEAPSAPPATDTPEPLPTAAEIPAAPEGTEVGQTPPSFAMIGPDGTTIESTHIIGSGKPVFMMYFATWWPTCRAELRTLSSIVPDHAEQVDFYLVAFNESATTLDGYISQNGYKNMTATQPVGPMLRDLQIVSQSSMLAVDGAGVITFRKGYGGRGVDFKAEFERLAR